MHVSCGLAVLVAYIKLAVVVVVVFFVVVVVCFFFFLSFFFFSSRRRHTRCSRDWSSDVCSSDLTRWPPDPTSFLPPPKRFLFAIGLCRARSLL